MRLRITSACVLAAALLMGVLPTAATAQAASTPTPPFTQCPAVGQDTSCQLLLVVNPDQTITVLGDSSQGPYDGADDTLVGIVNNSTAAVPAITVTGPGSGLAGLDGDGLCTYGVSGCPFGPTGYEGPGTTIKTDPTLPDEAEIDFSGAGLAAGASTYFSLEGALTAASITSQPGRLPSDVLSLSPPSQSLAAGTSATVTAQLVDSTSTPVAGTQVSFRVQSGPDAGATGTCLSSCSTDANGKVTWSFSGSNATAGATDTVQAWVDTNGDGAPSPGEPQATAIVNWSGATTNTCAAVLFVGARGSGESGPGTNGWHPNKADPNGFGAPVSNVYTRLQGDLGAGSSIEPEPVNYSADSVTVLAERHGLSKYFGDLTKGVNQTLNDLNKQAKLCPDQEIVLAGYSQGAMVMHRVLHLLDGSSAKQAKQILGRVAAAVLIGDGDQVSSDHEVMDGSAWHIAQGVGQAFPLLSGSNPAKFSSSLGSRIIRVCNWGDVVCDFQNNPLSDAYGYYVHTHYPNSKPLLQATKQAAQDAQTLDYYGGTLTVTGKVGTPISASAVVIGGKAPLTVFAGIDGTVPPWLALGWAGNDVVSLGGTPSGTGSWSFDVEVQDASNNVVTIPVSLTVK